MISTRPMWQWLSRQEAWALAGFVVVTWLILGPTVGSGYVLTLDMVFAPHIPMPKTVSNTYPFELLLHGASLLVPTNVIEYIILFAIVFSSLLGAYALILQVASQRSGYVRFGAVIGALIYAVNPFTYDRFMAGQYGVLLGYAVLPWFALALLRFVREPKIATMLGLVGVSLLSSMLSIHSIGYMLILGLMALACELWLRRRRDQEIKLLLGLSLTAALLAVFVSSFWLVPIVTNRGALAGEIGHFTNLDRSAFATIGDGFTAKLVHVLSLQGFWAEARNLFFLPQDVAPLWPVLTFLVCLLVAAGGVRLWRRDQALLIVFGAAALIAAILATGLGNGWMSAHVPFFAGYREPQKFVAVVALSYALFAAFGVEAILEFSRRQWGRWVVVWAGAGCLMVPCLWMSVMWFGFDHQLASVQYPSSWYRVNSVLDQDRGRYKVLFLPWHEYMYFSFAGRIIANPAPLFFDKPVISSNNPEFGGITPAPNATADAVTQLLAQGEGDIRLAPDLTDLGIKYVLLDHDDDYQKYGYISRAPGLKLLTTVQSLGLYVNEDYGQ
jgi:hypothetical protein